MKKKCRTCKKVKLSKNFNTGRTVCKSCQLKMTKKWQKSNPEKRRNQILKQKYGITLEFYNDLLKKQKNRCAVCKKEFPKIKKKTASGQTKTYVRVDHCHTTKIVRGLVCDRCNIFLGYLDTTPHLYEEAVKYLEQTTGVT